MSNLNFGTQLTPLTHFDPLQRPISDFYKFMQEPNKSPQIDLLRRHRLKEWHYFNFINEEHSISLGLLQMGYMALCSYTAYDFKTRKMYEQSEGVFLPLILKNPLQFSESSLSTQTTWNTSQSQIKIKQSPEKFDVELSGTFGKSKGDIFARFIVERRPQGGLSLSYPFPEGRSAYTHKELGLSAKGSAKFGPEAVSTHTGKYQVLSNWTKAVMPRETNWNWAALSFLYNQKKIELNLSQHLYDDREGRSFENALWVDGQMLPLGKALIDHQKGKIEVLPLEKISPVKGIKLNFRPLYEKSHNINLGLLRSELQRPIGLFTGTIESKLFPEPLKIEESHQALGLMEKHWALW